MKTLQEYLINEKTVLLTGEYDDFGKLCTRVIEGSDTFLVALKPMQVINNTLQLLGSNFHSVRETSKQILGDVHMCPIKVNCNLGIWLFPTKSHNNEFCVWFSLMHVKKTKPLGIRRTEVYLSYHHTFIIEMKESSFNHKRQKAEDLREAMLKNTQSPLTFYLEPRKGFCICEDEGRNPYKIK
ncbi:competence protein ComK [Mesobacillus boroniphilus]|uniref:competence protein ComK n=1 Tax=Mesobacillus boroniphilus TaxID=308892 RepID=UPI001BCEFEE4|nr:competence protein ComK [Mesobacillus boroniphilus]